MLLYKRIYECGNCGLKVDRDFNVVIMSKNYVNK